ncbi:MAG TPA: response regulator, partial [Nitrospirae bacterium]|nr:response regulator [Nitrospirota bacterium]
FYTTKDIGKGTGLGLSMVYGIIQRHNGYIHVDSEPGKGSSFKVFLPQIESAGLEVEPDAAISTERGTETVLIAEDEELLLKLMKKTLGKAGYRIITATDGEDAVQKHSRYENEIDLLFFDVAMPGIDGKQAYEEIKKTDPDIKVMFISGYGEMNDPRIRSILDEGKVIISKPVNINEILRKIRTVLG